jgi:hypothetical protein
MAVDRSENFRATAQHRTEEEPRITRDDIVVVYMQIFL